MKYASLMLIYIGLGVFVTASIFLIPYVAVPVFGRTCYNRGQIGMVVLGAILMAAGFAVSM